MADFDSKYVKCPYYHRSDNNRICCEGVDKENTLNIVFESPSRKKEFMQRFCFDTKLCHSCAVCKMLDEKWENILDTKGSE